MLQPLSLLLLLLLTLSPSTAAARQPTLLIYSKTTGYRHDSIPTAISSLSLISTSLNINTTFSEDSNLFTNEGLKRFDIIGFLSNSNTVDSSGKVVSDVLTKEGSEALKEWLVGGGSLLGFHAATACLYEDKSFTTALGSSFDYHPTIQNASFIKEISHPTINMLPSPYNIYEEVYSFRSNPRDVNVTVLLSVDPTSYVDNKAGTTGYYQGVPHPIAWFRDEAVDLNNGTGGEAVMRGRMWYTSLGHTNDTWQSEVFKEHIKAGIQWVVEGLSINNSTTSTTSSTSSSATSKASTVATTSSTNSISSTSGTNPSSTTKSISTPTPSSSAIRVVNSNSNFFLLICIFILVVSQM